MEEDIETCGWFVFYKDQLLIEKKNGMYTIPFGTEPPMPVPVGSTIHTIGEIEGRTAKTFSVHAPVPGSENDRHLMMDLRSSYDVLPWEEYNVGGKAFQILNWDKNSRYCPMCGVPTVQISPIAKKCPQCRQEIYPRISPAIIVLIRREDSILLVHARNFRGTFNGLVAGFLEPGETLEECVQAINRYLWMEHDSSRSINDPFPPATHQSVFLPGSAFWVSPASCLWYRKRRHSVLLVVV